MRVKLIAFVAAALMAMALVVPALAATTGNVTVSGSVPGTLSLQVTNGSSIGFTTLTLGQCNPANGSATLLVKSNASFTGSVQAAVTTGTLSVGELYRVAGSTAPTCGTGTNPGSQFSGNQDPWLTTQSKTTGTGTSYTESYALNLGSFDDAGSFTYTLTYSVSQ